MEERIIYVYKISQSRKPLMCGKETMLIHCSVELADLFIWKQRNEESLWALSFNQLSIAWISL